MLQVSATVHLASPATHWDVHLVDISRMGVAFASPRPFESGDSFMLSFRLPGDEKACTAHGIVVHAATVSDRPLYRVGARLRDMSAETEGQLMDFLTDPHR
jgi:hypothetical protein